MRVTIDTDYLLDLIAPGDYAYGVPAFFGFLGAFLLYLAIPGFAMLPELTGYGKFGLAIIAGVAIVSFVLAGYFVNEIDATMWGIWRKEDGEAPPETDES